MTNTEFKAEQAKLGLTNERLSAAFRVSVRAVEKWRQGTRPFPGPVCALFDLCAKRPDLVAELLPDA